MDVKVSYDKEIKNYKVDILTTVGDLIDIVRTDHNIVSTNIVAMLKEQKLKQSDRLAQLSLKGDSVIVIYVESSSSAQPVRKRICIPRRTDIDSEMKQPTDLKERVQKLRALFPEGQAPDDDTIITALENSYWNLDRAVDYLFPPSEKVESPLSEQQRKDIIQLTKLGYTPGTAIQVYFACDKKLEESINLIKTIDKEVDVKPEDAPKPE